MHVIKKRTGTDENILTLCGGDKGCCPEAEVLDDGNVLIKDDLHGRVKLTWEEAEHFAEKIPAMIRRLRQLARKNRKG